MWMSIQFSSDRLFPSNARQVADSGSRREFERRARTVQYVRLDHGRANVLVAQKFLDACEIR